MKKLLLILLCLPMIGFGQNVNIPDANFKAYLVGNTAINTNGDTEIQLSEATEYDYEIGCYGEFISDLTGIEAFTSLTSLNCSNNQLTGLDVSNNLALTNLICDFNQLTNLDLSNNLALIELNCGVNLITSLDVSNNLALTYLSCRFNQITNLDVSSNPNLIDLTCFNNQLTSLDVRNGNNTNFVNFDCNDNPNLFCINVDSIGIPPANFGNWSCNWPFYFSNNCSGTAIQEHTTKKELLKVTDLLGRETKGTKNEALFYIYDDGTVEKRIVIE